MSDLKLITSDPSLLKAMEERKEEERKKLRHDLFEGLKAEANEIAMILKDHKRSDGTDFALDNYLAFSFITLMNATAMVEQFKKPTMYLLNFWIDGQIQLKEQEINLNNGILSLEKK